MDKDGLLLAMVLLSPLTSSDKGLSVTLPCETLRSLSRMAVDNVDLVLLELFTTTDSVARDNGVISK